jgi:hypothetical protein
MLGQLIIEKKNLIGESKIPIIMMSISQAKNLSPQPAVTDVGRDGSLTGAPQFWQKVASSVNWAPQFLQYGIKSDFSF